MIKTWKDVKVGDKLWACEYGYNYNRTEKALIQPPVYGQIVKGKYYTSFTILKKDGMPRITLDDTYDITYANLGDVKRLIDRQLIKIIELKTNTEADINKIRQMF